jgi:arginyl-tRNA synthetase
VNNVRNVRSFSARETVREILVRTVNDLAHEGFVAAVTGDSVSVDRTKRPEHGDFASNVALALAKPAGKQPRAVAEAIVAGGAR